MNEVMISGSIDLESISSDFGLNLLTEMLEDPTNIMRLKIPLEIGENDKIVYTRVSILIIIAYDTFFDRLVQL